MLYPLLQLCMFPYFPNIPFLQLLGEPAPAVSPSSKALPTLSDLPLEIIPGMYKHKLHR